MHAPSADDRQRRQTKATAFLRSLSQSSASSSSVTVHNACGPDLDAGRMPATATVTAMEIPTFAAAADSSANVVVDQPVSLPASAAPSRRKIKAMHFLSSLTMVDAASPVPVAASLISPLSANGALATPFMERREETVTAAAVLPPTLVSDAAWSKTVGEQSTGSQMSSGHGVLIKDVVPSVMSSTWVPSSMPTSVPAWSLGDAAQSKAAVTAVSVDPLVQLGAEGVLPLAGLVLPIESTMATPAPVRPGPSDMLFKSPRSPPIQAADRSGSLLPAASLLDGAAYPVANLSTGTVHADPPMNESRSGFTTLDLNRFRTLPFGGLPTDGARSGVLLFSQRWSVQHRATVPIHDVLLKKSRLFFIASALGTPFAVSSVLPYRDSPVPSVSVKRKVYHPAAGHGGSVDSLKKRRAAESYAHLLEPSVSRDYDPTALDDPELRTGKHRTVITLPCYMGSIIQYARPSELKQELNDVFRQKHASIDPSVTLSKIRNLKSSLLEIGIAEDLEMSSIAKAYTLFEKLVLKNRVTKSNRKVLGAACLLLAVKINDRKDRHYFSLLETMEKELFVSAKEIRENEFPTFVALEFSLHLPKEEYMFHLERIIAQLDFYSVQEYLAGKSPIERHPQFI